MATTLKQTIKSTNPKLRPLVLALQAALATGVALPVAPIWGTQTSRVSVSSAKVQGNSHSTVTSISADGRFVAFESIANNLVADDTNGQQDIFVRDQLSNQTIRVSLNNAGVQGNLSSGYPAINASGRFVAFESDANNLVTGDTNGKSDVFVRDRVTNQTTRVSVNSTGIQSNSKSSRPSISANGRFVAFISDADNLVAGDTNGTYDVFVHDRQTKQTTRVSVSSTGLQGNDSSGATNHYPFAASISADGRFVAFQSFASNLVPNDTNEIQDIFVRDRLTNKTSRTSVNNTSVQGNASSISPSISADGRFVAFESAAYNLVAGDTNSVTDIFVRDRLNNKTSIVSVSSANIENNSLSYSPSISADGRLVAFSSDASNLVAGDINDNRDVFIRDRLTKQTTLVSASSPGGHGNLFSTVISNSSISADGRYVAFLSHATNLVAGDTNGSIDVFVRDRLLTPAITADLKLTQTVSDNWVLYGGNFSYTATVKNLGPGNANGVWLTDFAPLNGRASLPISLIPSQGACYQGSISICRLGTINAGQQATVQIYFTAIGPGVIANRVTVNAAPIDPTPFNSVTTKTSILPPIPWLIKNTIDDSFR